ncbi:major facilitator superfamily protein [Kipferlia bialata]|uniref:Major facilitator superfamily protein n=1 Tax=Kipferlia bialata TaxID=797122 RepID=A0A9K3CXQ4_9EUKA|nr:major facilitator superfamily protein [Kipferlia bialata]|eukprot:g6561.t1
MVQPTQETVDRLLNETRFTEKEIRSFFELSTSEELSRSDFGEIMTQQGLSSPLIQDRIWESLDKDGNGNGSISELVVFVAVLLRGTDSEVVDAFFRIFDLNGDGNLSPDEVIATYGQIRATGSEPLTPEQEDELRVFVAEADTNKDGNLDIEEFRAAITALKSETAKSQKKTMRDYLALAGLIFLTIWFETSTSFALPVIGALSSYFKDEYGVSDSQLGLLSGLYYLSATVGPMIGGLFVVKRGPTIVLVAANIVVLLGCVLLALPVRTFGMLVVARLVIGLGGEVTPFSNVETLALVFGRDVFMLMCGVRNLIQA